MRTLTLGTRIPALSLALACTHMTPSLCRHKHLRWNECSQKTQCAAGISYTCQVSAPTACYATCGNAGVRTTTRTCMSSTGAPAAASSCSNCETSTSPCPAVPPCTQHVPMHPCRQAKGTYIDTCTSEHAHARTHAWHAHPCALNCTCTRAHTRITRTRTHAHTHTRTDCCMCRCQHSKDAARGNEKS